MLCRLFILIFLIGFSQQVLAQERIVSLKPNITEILADLGVVDQLVGVTSYCDKPASVIKLPKVADYVHLDSEKIMALRPTLVIASQENSIEKEVRFLKNLGIRVEVYPFGRLDQINNSILKMGENLKVKPKAQEVLSQFEAELLRLQKLIAPNQKNQNIVFMVGLKPLVVVGSQNLIDDLMAKLNLGNIYRNSKSRYPIINIEDLILKSPEVIIDMSMGDEEKTKSEHWAQLKGFQSIPAIKNKQYYVVDVRKFRPALSLFEGARDLIEIFKDLP